MDHVPSRRGSYNAIVISHDRENEHHTEEHRMGGNSTYGNDGGDVRSGGHRGLNNLSPGGGVDAYDDEDRERGDYGDHDEQVSPDEHVTRTLYQESDIDWKTHSLPSLGRVSSDNTLGSASGLGDTDCYAIRKSVSRTNKNKQVSFYLYI